MREIETKANREPQIRALDDGELDAVTGGYMSDGGCIQYPTILNPWLPQAPKPFVDVFAKHTL